jgi:hypothetical protein
MNTPGYEEALRRIQTMTNGRLDLSNLGLSVLPPIPEGTRVFICMNNHLKTLPDLPSTLKLLHCDNNELEQLPKLPESLTLGLTCKNNRLVRLPKLPDHLISVICENNRIPTLPILPASLRLLDARNNPLIEPFRSFYAKALTPYGGGIEELRKNINSYYAPIKAKGRNISALKQTLGRQGPLPENVVSYMGSFISGKPGTLDMQATSLKQNAGLYGGKRSRRRTQKRKGRKIRSRKH